MFTQQHTRATEDFNCDIFIHAFEMFEPGMGARAFSLSIQEAKLGGSPQT